MIFCRLLLWNPQEICKDPDMNIKIAIPLSKDISEAFNIFLMREATDEEIHQIGKQLSP